MCTSAFVLLFPALPPDAYVHMHVIFFVIQAKHGTMINLRDDWQKKKEKRERTR